MTPVVVQDPADPRLADFVALTDVALRRRMEPAGGLFVAEGETVIRRAAAAGYRPRAFLMAARWLDSLADLVATDPAPVYVAAEPLLQAVTGYHVHRGALASFHRRPLPGPAALAAAARLVVVLEGVVDHTNVGAVFRSAAALGADAVLLDPRCADPLYRRAVRVSMGTVFQVPWGRLAGWPGDLALLREAGFRLLALTPDPGATDLAEEAASLRARDRVALLVGTEGEGLTTAALAAADVAVRIPMSAGVDSLNLAAAAAVACYALRTPVTPPRRG